MKKTFTVLCLLLSTTISLFGQAKPKIEPFIIQGQITNCPEKKLMVYYDDVNGDRVTDTLKLDQLGNFFFKTFNIKTPQQIQIQKNNVEIDEIFSAPGYNLTLTGNAKDLFSLIKTKRISGIGSESNKYQIVLDSIRFARMDLTNVRHLKDNDFLTYIKKDQKLKDSVAQIVFVRKPIQDKYLRYMGALVRLDNEFSTLTKIIEHVLLNKYNYKKSVDIVQNNFDHDILNNIYREDYLKSNVYKSMIRSVYLEYLNYLDLTKESTAHKNSGNLLEKVNKVYTGKVKDYVLYYRMNYQIEHAKSFEKINSIKEQFKPYISNLKDAHYKKNLNAKFSEKVVELMSTQIGKPAPKFVLVSNLGKTYRLEDFKGKVVYLDLWASWCAPCRAETPDFKILYDKFRNNDQVAFISIAVSDGLKEWKKALEEDNPSWIQLIDKDGIVNNSYVANVIPKFILIDKKGNIVNFDAPRPSSGVEIEKLLNQEIAK